jgi:hypothetical protein
LAYKYSTHPVSVEIEVTKHEEIPVLVAAIDAAHYVTLLTEEGKVLTKATFNMRNNVKQFMRLALPKGATFLNCFVSGKPVKPAQDASGRVLVPLEKSEALGETVTQFPVEIMYLTQKDKLKAFGRFTMSLPELDIPTSQLYWSVYAPEEYNYGWFQGDVKKVEATAPMGLFTALGGQTAGRRMQVAEKSASVVSAGYQSQLRLEDKLVQEVRARKGVLPIKMEMPTEGRVFRFSKLLVTDESPWLAYSYLRNFREARGLLGWVVFLLVFLGAGALGGKDLRGNLSFTTTEKTLWLLGALFVGLCVWLAHVSFWILLWALVLAVIYLAIWKRVSGKR